jgi:hypothetical protein
LDLEFYLDYTEIRLAKEFNDIVTILSVMPAVRSEMLLHSYLSLEINFDRVAPIKKLVNTSPEEHQICWIVPKFETTDPTAIRPRK